MKKINGRRKDDHYRCVDDATGEVWSLLPEYSTMSLKPGIGSGWYDKFKSDVYPADSIVVRGKKMRPPTYYDRKYEHDMPADFMNLKILREDNAYTLADDNTPERLAVKEEVKRSQISSLTRSIV
ncbi:hypothetical protein HUE58_04940 [Candidatus Ruthia endofausta]|uniref:Uncharacterized protein n=1 Tax=Candidatus Ruthia endofausta TaxID=2738852 RepID=A0A6N0HQ73_9GAMM|nr:hypothetical protein [Candidatus Ruthia endofausta]QKQ24465.1 hypothetical protein HUE58_04940 [Candidatus Ruthia endofausta]